MSKSSSKSLSWQFLTVVSILLLFSGIGLLSIYSLDEAKNAGAAREMFLNQDFITPTFNSNLRTDKPPLHYYFMNVGYTLFGITPFGARFFSSVMGLLTLAVLFLFASKIWNKKVAITSVLILLSSVHFLLQMQMAVPDPYLILLLSISFFSFYNLWKFGERKYWWMFYISIGFGVLAKGPIAIALPGLAGLLFLLVSKTFNWKTILKMNPFLGLPLSVLIPFPWFYLVHQKTDGAFTDGFFLEHNINRYSESFEGHNGSPLLTIAFIFLGFLPFVFFLPSAIINAWKKKETSFIYLFCVAIAIIGFFMTSGTKLPNYTVPAYPAISLLLGYFFASENGKKWQWVATLIWCISIAICGFLAFQYDETLKDLKWHALFFAIPVFGAIFALLNQKNSFRIYSASWMVFAWIFFILIYPRVDALNPVRQTQNLIPKDATVVGYKIFNPAFVFALNQEIPKFENVKDLEEFVRHNDNVIVLSRKSYLGELHQIEELKIEAEAKDILETPTTLILTIR